MHYLEMYGASVWDRLLACTLDESDRYRYSPPINAYVKATFEPHKFGKPDSISGYATKIIGVI